MRTMKKPPDTIKQVTRKPSERGSGLYVCAWLFDDTVYYELNTRYYVSRHWGAASLVAVYGPLR